MTVPEATSRCAQLEILPWDERVITRELARMSAALLAASPQVTAVPDAPGIWWVGASGFEPLGGERMLALVLQQLASVWHPSARVGVADSCVAARAATWSVAAPDPHYVRIVPPGGCAAYLASAPLALVPMDAELREALGALGLHTVGTFAGLEAADVEHRWGASGLASWRLAHGIDTRRPVLARSDATRAVSTELALSADSMEPVLFIVRAALGQLVDALVHDARAAAAIAITLTLDDGRGAVVNAPAHTITREVRPARPMARVAPLFERCRALLDQWKLPAPVCAVTVTVTATAPMSAEQGDLLAASWRDPGAADAAFERLRASLGAHSVVRPVARDEHRPEKAGAWAELHEGTSAVGEPSPTRKSVRRESPAPQQSGRRTAQRSESFAKERETPAARTETSAETSAENATARLLETPERIDVEVAHSTPRTLWWRGKRVVITRAVGPERLSGDWWKDPFARDYWRCESEELARDMLLYRDAVGWHLQGWYD
jgi:protein ImuB